MSDPLEASIAAAERHMAAVAERARQLRSIDCAARIVDRVRRDLKQTADDLDSLLALDGTRGQR